MHDSLVVKTIIMDFFGNDIGSLVFYYFVNIRIETEKKDSIETILGTQLVQTNNEH